MKLQLDSSALQYLIENSGEGFLLELQSSVVQAFAKKYLKALVDTEDMQKAEAEVKRYIDAWNERVLKEIMTSIGTVKSRFDGKVTLETLSTEAQRTIRVIVNEQKQDVLKQLLATSPQISKEELLELWTYEYKNQIRQQIRQEVMAEIRQSLV